MLHLVVSYQDQEQGHQIQVPTALGVEIPRIDKALLLVVYLQEKQQFNAYKLWYSVP